MHGCCCVSALADQVSQCWDKLFYTFWFNYFHGRLTHTITVEEEEKKYQELGMDLVSPG